ncbi:MAG: hypothetical protein O7G86_04860 [Gammaproteobacteria bacterium]|nr:hypothetical protein [Gammaproteobacteria bacterium]
MSVDESDPETSIEQVASGNSSSVVTLERLQKIARFLAPLKWVSLVGFTIFVITFVFSVVEAHLDQYIIPSVVGGMWAMLLFAFIAGFQVIPSLAPTDGSFTERVAAQIARAAYWGLAVLTGFASLGALILTFRLLVIWSSEPGT